MKRIIGMLAIVGFLAGCGSTPTARWASATQALTVARDTTLTLHTAGIVDDPTLVKLDKIEKTARGALAVAETQLPDGGDSFEEWMLVAKGGIVELAKTYGESSSK